ncbi:capsular polysaccharide biosynthesis protein Cap8F [Clostridium polyendosporum]|uniref:Capsular polysaccharide biosynthesis protein Cap8F n=1 Tax=Clostridium polyendosporum TaxID=69208 RepID=A0A919RZL4_9CLOT|nr:NAD-dependent epimerase/dehydratase family protein [Clostridium polyendosporum]GIM28714.1 capsular polysaccharide biosynthesis protein Cap8F [Clostridium polyendosporum]
MKVLVTGAKGFIGKNFVTKLNEDGQHEIITYDVENSKEELYKYIKAADFIFHLAGVNRPKDEKGFFQGNSELTGEIAQFLIDNNMKTPILMTSSIQAELDNPYGQSKKAAEERLKEYSQKTGAKIFIYRLPNVFGKWCRPNYNSAVATFCYNIARDKEVWISDENKELTLVYIDDVVSTLIKSLDSNEESKNYYYSVETVYKTTLGEIVSKIKSFREIRDTSIIPNMKDDFTKVLYSTYLSYLEEDNFSYKLNKKADNRGWLTELVKSKEFGQMFVSKTFKGIIRGNHYHHTKVEKFIVVQGEAIIRFRKIDEDKVIEYRVTGESPEVVDIPSGYTHSIENIGEEEVITLFWANEIFNQEQPDTYFSEVVKQ